MGWTNVVQDCKAIFLLAYAIFIAVSIVRWIITSEKSEFVLRDWFGSLGLALGACSAMLFAWFYLYWWTEHRVIAHGFAQWLYFIVGGCLAALGFILGLTGRGWVRRSTSTIALVMIFQWWGAVIFGSSRESAVTIAMFVSLAAFSIIWFGISNFGGKFRGTTNSSALP